MPNKYPVSLSSTHLKTLRRDSEEACFIDNIIIAYNSTDEYFIVCMFSIMWRCLEFPPSMKGTLTLCVRVNVLSVCCAETTKLSVQCGSGEPWNRVCVHVCLCYPFCLLASFLFRQQHKHSPS